MTKHFHTVRHLVDFLLLGGIVAVGLYGLLLLNFDRGAQVAVVLVTAMLYVFWGIFHHYHDANLSSKVILDYCFIALLTSAILIIFLLRI